MQGAKGLEMLGVRTLDMQLQGVGKGIVLIEECLTDGRYPLVGISIEVTVYGLTRPQGDVVQVDDIIIRSAIDERTQLTISDGERLLEISSGFVILKYHWGLLCCCSQAENRRY